MIFEIDIALDKYGVLDPVHIAPLGAEGLAGPQTKIEHQRQIQGARMRCAHLGDDCAVSGRQNRLFSGGSGCGFYYAGRRIVLHDAVGDGGAVYFTERGIYICYVAGAGAREAIKKGLQFQRPYGAQLTITEDGQDMHIEGVAVGLRGAYRGIGHKAQAIPFLGVFAENPIVGQRYAFNIVFYDILSVSLQFPLCAARYILVDVVSIRADADFHAGPVHARLLFFRHCFLLLALL